MVATIFSVIVKIFLVFNTNIWKTSYFLYNFSTLYVANGYTQHNISYQFFGSIGTNYLYQTLQLHTKTCLPSESSLSQQNVSNSSISNILFRMISNVYVKYKKVFGFTKLYLALFKNLTLSIYFFFMLHFCNNFWTERTKGNPLEAQLKTHATIFSLSHCTANLSTTIQSFSCQYFLHYTSWTHLVTFKAFHIFNVIIWVLK